MVQLRQMEMNDHNRGAVVREMEIAYERVK